MVEHSQKPLQGRLGWFDFGRRSNRSRETATVERAILRPGALLMEFVADGAEYEASLDRGLDGVFRGSWQRGRPGAVQQRGAAECTLAPLSNSEPHVLKLEGKWFEEIDWDWYGRLEDTIEGSTSDER